MDHMDEMLQDALSPAEEMGDELKRNILMRVTERKEQNMGDRKVFGNRTRRFSAAAAIAAATLMATSITAFAAWNYLSARDVAKELDDGKLAGVFEKEDAWNGAEVQSYGGFDISLIGLVSGENISDQLVTDRGEVFADNTYAVVAIRHSDGTPMPDTSDDEYKEQDFLVSPYIEGYDPARYNIFTLQAGGYAATVENGTEYRIMGVENIEAFADHTIYLGVTDGTFYNREAFTFDEDSGRIAKNEDYSGVNALFTLPIDKSRADSERAAEMIAEVDHPAEDDGSEDIDLSEKDEAEEFMSKLTVDNIETYAEPVESTRQTLTPDENGEYTYRYELPGGISGSGTASLENEFPDGKAGMRIGGWSSPESSSEGGRKDLLIETYTLNEDGTVTFVIYVPKED